MVPTATSLGPKSVRLSRQDLCLRQPVQAHFEAEDIGYAMNPPQIHLVNLVAWLF